MTGRLLGFGLAALALIGAGAALTTAPQRIAGPMNLDFGVPLGAAALLFGIGGFEQMVAAGQRVPRVLYAAAALLAGGVAGWNFYHYPPISDGAYFMLRYGQPAGDWTPSSPAGMLLGAATGAWAVDRTLRRDPARRGVRPLIVRLIGLIAWTALACAGYSLFMDMLVRASVRDALAGVPLACVPVALACHGLKWRFEGARSGLALSLTTLVLSLASWMLYRQ